MRRLLIIMVLILFLLTGCGSVEPEKRDYPLTLAIDLDETGEQYLVVYGLANLPESTGQSKPEENNGRNGIFTGNSLKETEKKYRMNKEKRLDLGHVEAILVGEKIKSSGTWDNLWKEWKQRTQLREDICLFATEDILKAMECNGNQVDSLGEYLMGLYENREVSTEQAKVTLGELYNHLDKNMEAIKNKIPNIDNTLHIIRGEMV